MRAAVADRRTFRHADSTNDGAPAVARGLTDYIAGVGLGEPGGGKPGERNVPARHSIGNPT